MIPAYNCTVSQNTQNTHMYRTYRQTGKQAVRQTERQRNKQADTQVGR